MGIIRFSIAVLVPFFMLSCTGGEKKNAKEDVRIDDVASNLRQALNKYPDSLQLIEQLIQYYRDNGKYDTALLITDNAIKRDSQVAELWDIKATLHYENEDTVNSIKAFEKAVEIYPLPEYIISLGTLYAQTKNLKAITLADALIFANRSKAQKEALFIKGLYYHSIGKSKTAMTFFDSCIHIDYTYMFAYREKALIYYETGKYAESLAVLTRAVTFQNNFEEGYYYMGQCNEKLNRIGEAIQSYQSALMYDRDYTEAREALKRLDKH